MNIDPSSDGNWISEFGSAVGYDELYTFLDSSTRAKIKEIGAESGLNPQESLAVYAYTLGVRCGVSPFAMINGSLRNGSPSGRFVLGLVNDLLAALPKLKRFTGITFRKVTLPPEIREKCVTGTIYSDSAFLSTSTDPNVFAGQDMMLIKASCGVKISHLSAFPHEEEVLFLPNTAFHVDRVEEFNQGLLIELSEN